MLTKGDLLAIKTVVKGEVKSVVRSEVKSIIVSEIKGVRADIKELRTDINLIQKDLKPIKGELRKLRKDLTVVISLFDNDITDTKLRVDRIEANLHLPSFVPQTT